MTYERKNRSHYKNKMETMKYGHGTRNPLMLGDLQPHNNGRIRRSSRILEKGAEKKVPGRSLVVGRTKKITSVSTLRSLLHSVGGGGGAACCCFPCPPSLSPALPRSLPPRPIRRRGAVAVAVAIALPPRPPDGQFVRTTILIQIRSCAAKERGRQTDRGKGASPSFLAGSLLFTLWGFLCHCQAELLL